MNKLKIVHFFYSLILGGFFLWACSLILISYWLFWPVKTLEVKNLDANNSVHVLNNMVHPGDRLQYRLDYCKYSNDSVVVHRTLVDGQVIALVDTNSQIPLGCHDINVATAVIPDTVAPGHYYLDVTVVYRINPIRTESKNYHTDYFDVVAKPTTYKVEINGQPFKIDVKSSTTTKP